MKFKLASTISLLAASLAFATPTSDLPFGKWKRASNGPVLAPQGTTWESAGTFNPATVLYNGKIAMLYRAQDASGTSRLGYAESFDGVHFTRSPRPLLFPETDYEKDGGVEDPRLQKFGYTYYLTYTGYNKKDAQLCLATSLDLIHWERKGVILPAYKGNWNKGWTKSGAIVPQKIDAKYWMYWLGTAVDKTDQMGLSYSTDLIHWTEATDSPVLPRRPGMFDSRVAEPGPPRPNLQRRRRQSRLSRRRSRLRPQRSPQTSLPLRRPHLRPGKRLGKGRPSSKRHLCGRYGPRERPLALLLRWCRQICWSRRGSSNWGSEL